MNAARELDLIEQANARFSEPPSASHRRKCAVELWDGIKAPQGWELSAAGVFEVRPGKDGEPDKREAIAGPLWVVGLTTGTAGDWGRLLAFTDHDGCSRQLAIPAARVHEDPAILARELANMGLRIIPGRERRMVAYLASYAPENRIPSAPRLGWMDRRDGGLAFVFPDRVLMAGGHETVVYQPERYSPTAATLHAGGTLADWQAMAALLEPSDTLLFALCAGLAAPWLPFADGDSFVLHFWGTTTRGKTTLAQVAASPWGCAADPADAPSLSFIRRWNVTGNGAEGLAEAYSDLPLPLDELGAGHQKPELIYQLAGGQGKTAMSADRQLKAPRAWRTIVISTGELSIHAKLSEHGTVKGGITHRAIDVEVSDIAEHVQGDQSDRAAFVQGIKRACATHYGAAGPAMLQAIIQTYPTAQAARAAVRDHLDKATAELIQPHHAPEQARALRRFALIAWAGAFASRAGVLPIKPGRVWQAVKAMAGRWGSNGMGTDGDRILEAVRGFILRHGARFQDVSSGVEVRDRAGFRDVTGGRWMFSKDALIEAAPGHDVVTIARAIRDAGHLFTNDANLNPKLVTPAGRIRVYCVLDGLLSDDPTSQDQKQLGQLGHLGQAAPDIGFQPALQGQEALGQLGHRALAPYPQETTRAGANPHSDGLCPSALAALAENSAASIETDSEAF